jgi:hypothetical protein
MKRNSVNTSVWKGMALGLMLGFASQANAQATKTPYPNMAPLEQYLMDRNAEIALAQTAAPESISRDAEVLVLGRHGYETALKGKNGFVCVVQRSWTGARTRLDVLHAVQARISERSRRSLAPALDVLHSPDRAVGLGRQPQRVSSPRVQRHLGTADCLPGSCRRVVRRHSRS